MVFRIHRSVNQQAGRKVATFVAASGAQPNRERKACQVNHLKMLKITKWEP